MSRQQVVIIGGGFGGLSAVRALANAQLDVLLLNRENYYTSSPLLHQVATKEIEPQLIACPIHNMVKHIKNVRFITANVKQVDLSSKCIQTDEYFIPYDFLIIATGSDSKLLGIPGAREYTLPLKKLDQAVNLRNQIIGCLEQGTLSVNPSLCQQLLTFTIIGGGATGVELAASMIEMIAAFAKNYPTLDLSQVRVILLQAGDSLVPQLSRRLCTYLKLQLEKMGVQVLLRSRVSHVTSEAVYLQDSTVIPTKTTIWTGGVTGNPLARTWGLPTDNNGRVTVLPTLQVPQHPQVYVVGDLASLAGMPMSAPVAIQQGKIAANNIIRQIQHKKLLPMRYRHMGNMVILGRYNGVLDLGQLQLTGVIAWLLWLAVHLLTLPGFRNQLLVLRNWIWGCLVSHRFIGSILPLSSVNKLTGRRKKFKLIKYIRPQSQSRFTTIRTREHTDTDSQDNY
ncbi:MAG: NAD(P)/FAD-dependent oxidoreductase [Calothrix sp. MO_167.B42]|nr:NAD(P)/FAD-dependent oxidoreductase [Calothrix sp. MO_167.B42]